MGGEKINRANGAGAQMPMRSHGWHYLSFGERRGRAARFHRQNNKKSDAARISSNVWYS